jgi:hypothetical protein
LVVLRVFLFLRSQNVSIRYYGLDNGGYASQEKAYKIITENAGLVMALKFLLQTEPLAVQAATLRIPVYSSFRD